MVMEAKLTSDLQIIKIGLISKALAVLYGILAVFNFDNLYNLNLWIISGYIPTLLSLSNVILSPSMQIVNKRDKSTILRKLNQVIHGSKVNKRFTRLGFFLFLQTSILFLMLTFGKSEKNNIEVIYIFLLQSLQLPFILSMLRKNEESYFERDRVVYLKSSLMGNFLSFLTAVVFTAVGLPIDQSALSFASFVGLQIGSLVLQSCIYSHLSSSEARKEADIGHNKQKRVGRIENILGVRAFIYIPGIFSYTIFISDSNTSAISSIFFGLNLMSLVTYFGLPNDKASFVVSSPEEIVRSLKDLLARAFSLMILIFIAIISFSYLVELTDKSIGVLIAEDFAIMLLMSFVGVFLLPIITISNNQTTETRNVNVILQFSISSLFVVLFSSYFVFNTSALDALLLSYSTSFLFWYSLLFIEIGGKKSD